MVPGARCPVPGAWCLGLGARCLGLGAWCIVPGACCLLPAACCLVPGAWCLSEGPEESGVVDVVAFPPLGLAGSRPIVPQAKHTAIVAGMGEALAYPVNERERRRVARKDAGDAQDRARLIQEAAQQRARQAANLARRAPVTQARTPQRSAQSTSSQMVRQPLARTQDSRPASRIA